MPRRRQYSRCVLNTTQSYDILQGRFPVAFRCVWLRLFLLNNAVFPYTSISNFSHIIFTICGGSTLAFGNIPISVSSCRNGSQQVVVRQVGQRSHVPRQLVHEDVQRADDITTLAVVQMATSGRAGFSLFAPFVFICFCHSTSFFSSVSSCWRKSRQIASTRCDSWPLLPPLSATRFAIMPQSSFQLRSGY